jgi:hypothetical protein
VPYVHPAGLTFCSHQVLQALLWLHRFTPISSGGAAPPESTVYNSAAPTQRKRLLQPTMAQADDFNDGEDF